MRHDGITHQKLTLTFFLLKATEADDDDGLPHTLEHVIFMGSEDYPFKVSSYAFVHLNV